MAPYQRMEQAKKLLVAKWTGEQKNLLLIQKETLAVNKILSLAMTLSLKAGQITHFPSKLLAAFNEAIRGKDIVSILLMHCQIVAALEKFSK